DFVVGDAACWDGSRQGELWQPDMIMSRHGVMFFADPVQAFSNLHKNASDHAHLVFSCFRTRKDNIWASAVASLLPPGSGPDPDDNAPGPFAFARQDYVRTILSRSGWKNITFEPIDYFHVAGRGKNALDDAIAFYSSIGPAAAALRMLNAPERNLFRNNLRKFLRSYETENEVALPAAAWIVSCSS
ncbi:MAG: methyltransferase, partial [Sphingomonadaceae bacterium]